MNLSRALTYLLIMAGVFGILSINEYGLTGTATALGEAVKAFRTAAGY